MFFLNTPSQEAFGKYVPSKGVNQERRKGIQGTRDPTQETAMGILRMMMKGNARKKTL